MRVLEIGVGYRPLEGEDVVHLDRRKLEHVEVVWDIDDETGLLPFNDEEFDMVVIHHVLEHLLYFREVMQEMWRVLKIGGTLDIKVPNYKSSVAFVPGHLRFFGRHAFDTFDCVLNPLEHYDSTACFKLERIEGEDMGSEFTFILIKREHCENQRKWGI